MQYILTEKEFQELNQKPQPPDFSPVRKFILKLADEKCIHEVGQQNRLMYCDECPLQNLPAHVDILCTQSKEYSK